MKSNLSLLGIEIKQHNKKIKEKWDLYNQVLALIWIRKK